MEEEKVKLRVERCLLALGENPVKEEVISLKRNYSK
jgi:hypothetical protein